MAVNDDQLLFTASDLAFPRVGVMPKQETGAAMFLEQYPEYDGRGVTVAILDTGCDPGSDGLVTTPDGKPKFVDVLDATGSGDVDTSKTVVMDAKTRIVEGLSGRSLKIPESWQLSASNEFHVGILRAYDTYPGVLTKRLNRERSKKFNDVHTKKLDNLRADIENMQKLLNSSDHGSQSSQSSKGSDESSEPERMDLKTRIEDTKKLLAQLEKESCVNCGPVYDVLVWNTGSEWLAYLETSTAGAYYNCEDVLDLNDGGVIDLTAFEGSNRPITNFRVRQEFNKMSEFDNCNYALNIYDAGTRVSVVVPAGSHGTHVAGIVGAYFKDDPTKNGVAPGCQLVSIKIGDTRLGSMETNQGLLRALTYLKELKCDLANMSYGEPSTTPFGGAFVDGVNELVWKYGTIFVSSAGNDGPCLSTAGAPQAAATAIIGVGAIFSSSMLEAEYCMANSNLPLNAYSWSSRGPTTCGSLGVKICAPGGAIAPVPTFTLDKHTLMNGTSMSSPNACGNVALLLSGLKALGCAYSPNGVETALINTARPLARVENLAAGHGLIQVHAAFDYCVRQRERKIASVGSVVELPLHFSVSVSGGPNNQVSGDRGIYVREPQLQGKVLNYQVYVSPRFEETFGNEEKTGFELKCTLKATKPWVQCANYALVAHRGRSFQVQVDVKQFRKFVNGAGAGSNKLDGYEAVYTAEVLGFDAKNAEAGPLFRVPVTVVNPVIYEQNSAEVALRNGFVNDWARVGREQNEDACYVFKRIDDFGVGTIRRYFHAVPQGVCAAKVSVKALNTGNDKPTRCMFSTLYTKGYQAITYDRWFRASTGSTHEWLFEVEASTVLETTVTQYALDDNTCRLEWSVEFEGPLLSTDHIYLNENAQFTEVSLRSNVIPATHLKPSVTFDRYITYVAPKFATISTLSADRGDTTVNGERYYALELEYEFDSECKGDSYFTLPKVADLLYESVLGGIFYQVFDKNRKLVGSGEAFRETIKLDKLDKYLYKVQIRHDALPLLESLKNLKLEINAPLNPSVTSDVYYGRRALLRGNLKNKVQAMKLPQFGQERLFIASPSKDVSIKSISAGDVIRGWMKLNSDAKNFLMPRFRHTGCLGPASYCVPASMVLGPANVKKAKSRNDENGKDKDNKDNKDGKDAAKDAKDGNKDGKDGKEEESVGLEEKQRDVVIDWIKKLKGKEQVEAFEQFIENGLMKKYDKHLPLLELKMNVYAAVKDKEMREKSLGLVMKAADDVLNAIDQNAVATHFGRNGDSEDKEWVKADKKYKEEKQLIIKALFAKLQVVFEVLSKEETELEAQAAQAADLKKGAKGKGEESKQEEKSDVVVTNGESARTSGTTNATTSAADAQLSLLIVNEKSSYDRIKPVLSKDKLSEFDAIVKEIKQWANIEKSKICKEDYFEMKLWRLKQDRKYGEILSLVNDNDNNNNNNANNSNTKKSYDDKLNVFKKYFGNQFKYLVQQKELAKFEEFPADYRLF